MNFYLMRHGAAVPGSDSDPERALTDEGLLESRRVLETFAATSPGVDRMVVSPWLRARQTADLALAIIRQPPPLMISELLLPGADPLELLHWLGETWDGENIMLVGHNPLLSRLTTLMLHGGGATMNFLEPSHLVCVAMEHAMPGLGDLKFFIDPSAGNPA